MRTIGEAVAEYLELMEQGQAAVRMRQIEDEIRGRRVQIQCDWFTDARSASGVLMSVAVTGAWVSTPIGSVQVSLERLAEVGNESGG